jgi:hypothetical protein
MTTKKTDVYDYFAGDAWGIEYFAGYTFPIGQYAVKTIQPYFMGDRLEYVNGRNYQRIDNWGSASSWITVSALIMSTSLRPAPTTWAI